MLQEQVDALQSELEAAQSKADTEIARMEAELRVANDAAEQLTAQVQELQVRGGEG